MVMKLQPELVFNPDQPSEIVTQTADEFLSVCQRADQGELEIQSLETIHGRNSWWKVRVRWPE
jgi:hypothetical protein